MFRKIGFCSLLLLNSSFSVTKRSSIPESFMPPSAPSSQSYPDSIKCFKKSGLSYYLHRVDVTQLPLEIKVKFPPKFNAKGHVDGTINDVYYHCEWNNRQESSVIFGPLNEMRKSFDGILDTKNAHGNVMTISSILVDVLNNSIQPGIIF